MSGRRRLDRQMDAARRARRDARIEEAKVLAAGCARAVEEAIDPRVAVHLSVEELVRYNAAYRGSEER